MKSMVWRAPMLWKVSLQGSQLGFDVCKEIKKPFLDARNVLHGPFTTPVNDRRKRFNKDTKKMQGKSGDYFTCNSSVNYTSAARTEGGAGVRRKLRAHR
jgi:hypothetical protein